jgi:peroxiredoxin/mono/diheme cytochrome c family protein
MKHRFAISLVALLAAPSASFAQLPPNTAAADAIFQRADKNGDGKVTREELPDERTFARFDLNKDGVIDIEEARQVLGGMISQGSTATPGAETAAGATQGQNGAGKGKLAELFKRLLNRDRSSLPAPSTAPSSNAPSTPAIQGPKQLKAGDVGVGRQVPDFPFTTRDGKAHRLGDWKSKKGVVVAFTSATCPLSKRYAPSLARLEKELQSRDIALLLVNPLGSEKAEDIAAQIQEQSFRAAYVHDVNKAVAQALQARTTTEVFLLDPNRTLIYRGALDDQYGVSHSLDAPRETFLLSAVTAMLAGSRPTIAATEAPGCELDVPASATTTGTHATYHRDVARILQQNCITCHHDKGIAPFALDDLADVQDRVKAIQRVVEAGTMPPWFAAPAPEGKENPWANDRSLSARDKADLLGWIGSPERPAGNPADAPAPLHLPDEWTIGKPDLVVQLSRPFSIKAEGTMPYQFTTVETTLAEDKWVQAYEIRPTAREVVHHVIVQVHEKGSPIRRGGEEGAGGYWAAYVPGNSSHIYPDGFARKLPAGATVSFQIHYTPSGKATEEQLRMGLVFAKQPPRFAVRTVSIAGPSLKIPPGEANHVETAQKTVPFDLNVTAYMAHMHVRGKAFKFEVTYPDGKSETLLDIPRYDFNWQLRYDYKEPRLIPRGSTVKITAVYDNSPGNKANPDPTKTVRWGPQTADEMMLGYIEHFIPLPATQTVSAR